MISSNITFVRYISAYILSTNTVSITTVFGLFWRSSWHKDLLHADFQEYMVCARSRLQRERTVHEATLKSSYDLPMAWYLVASKASGASKLDFQGTGRSSWAIFTKVAILSSALGGTPTWSSGSRCSKKRGSPKVKVEHTNRLKPLPRSLKILARKATGMATPLSIHSSHNLPLPFTVTF